MKIRLLCLFVVITSGLVNPARSADQSPTTLPVQVIESNFEKELLAGPEKPEDFPAWLAGMRAYRQEIQTSMQKSLGQMADAYNEPALRWTQKSFVESQMMAQERYFYEPVTGRYTVRRYLDDLRRRYGGIDSVLIWPTYPNIGVDDRNQFDLWRDMPGGLAGLHQMVEEFHRQGVHVLIPIMIWDNGTHETGLPMPQAINELAKAIGVDGLNGDTMMPIYQDFYTQSLAINHPIALEPEEGMGKSLDALAWNTLSWGYWEPYQIQPGVDRYKFVEPRHVTYVCDRWAHDRTVMLQSAFFNGDGYESWENVWGIWNPVTPRDGEALRRISAIDRAMPELLASPDYEPFTPMLQKEVYATKFPGKDGTLWTIISRTNISLNGPQIRIPYSPGMSFFDLWHGSELKPEVVGNTAILTFELEPYGYGAVFSTTSSCSASIKKLIVAMRCRSQIKLGNLSSEWKVLPQQIVAIAPTCPASSAPEGMVLVSSGKFHFQVAGTEIETNQGVDIQYPWENQPDQKHDCEMFIKSFYIDKTPVTCAEFKRFLEATHYHPKDSHNFLRSWTNGNYPIGWSKKPVTWVSIEDARAYAKWAGKRLPHEWEWQYAAQGSDGRLYPWSNEMDQNRIPTPDQGRNEAPPADVDAHPEGASPFGVLDLVGNVWQWTDEYRDEHTRAAILKGGSHYHPVGSAWYFPQAKQLNQHGKYLLMAPGLDRSATIGFRCVVDTK